MSCGHFLYPECGCAVPNVFPHNHLAVLGMETLQKYVPPQSGEPFSVVVADPPWKFGDKLPGKTRGAEKQYDVMRVEDICRLELPPIADNAHLFLWRVSSMPQEALDVIKAWGFVVKSELVWVKKTKNGKPHFGMGRHVRLGHEVCHIATRGKGAGILNRSQRSVFTTELDDDGGGSFEAAVGRHSQKPDEFYQITRDLVPGPRLELFARQAREGFTVIGNQVPGAPTTLMVGESQLSSSK